jgi:hypothetical protein
MKKKESGRGRAEAKNGEGEEERGRETGGWKLFFLGGGEATKEAGEGR